MKIKSFIYRAVVGPFIFAATFVASAALGLTSADSLMGLGMSPELANYLTSQVFSVANGTGVITLRDSTKILADADAQRVFDFDASSDTALTMQFGDGGTTAVQGLTISAATADADDDATLQLGFAAGTRGAGITLPGEEVSGGSDITYNAGTSDTHIFNVAGTLAATIGASSLVTAGTITGVGDFISTTSGGTLSVQEATAGAKCMGTATANGTTAVVVSTTCATTGSRIFLSRSSAPSGTAQCWWDTLSNGVSFNLDCSAAETGTFDWLIVHEAP